MIIDCVALMSYIPSTECERRASTNSNHEDKIKRTSIDVKCCKHHKHASANHPMKMPAAHLRPAPTQLNAPSIAAGAKRPSGGVPV